MKTIKCQIARIVDSPELTAWIESRPEIVRNILTEFPLGTQISVKGQDWIVFGANEGGQLIIVPARSRNYNESLRHRAYVCADHLRRGEVLFEAKR